jgi:hypothetical protein
MEKWFLSGLSMATLPNPLCSRDPCQDAENSDAVEFPALDLLWQRPAEELSLVQCCCSQARQMVREEWLNRILPLGSFTCHCCVAWLNSMLVARLISRGPMVF